MTGRSATATCSDLCANLAAVRGEVRFDEPLARYTSMKIGGPADALVFEYEIVVRGRKAAPSL